MIVSYHPDCGENIKPEIKIEITNIAFDGITKKNRKAGYLINEDDFLATLKYH